MKQLAINKLFIFFLLLFTLNTGCLDQLASSILYQNDEANKIKVPEEAPAPFKKIDIQEGKNRTVGWYYQSENVNAPVLIFFHGNGSNIGGLHESGFLEKLLTFKIHFAVFDYPKYGLSTGDLNQNGVLKSGQHVIDYMKKLFPNSHMVLWGRSLGCAPATLLTEKNINHVDALILTSPWDSFWKLAKHKSNLPDAACKNAAKGNEYESEVAAKKINLPVLIHHGTLDETIPFSMGENMAKSFETGDVTFVPIEGAGHNNLLGDKEWAEIYRFIHVW